jgi:hypothetical protein
MGNFIQTFDQISYKKVFSIAIFLAVVIAVPVAVVVVQQQTRIDSRAAYEKPNVVQNSKQSPGPVPEKEPQLGRVFPWVGKIGDIVWIQGKNFGTNPVEKKLVIGGIEIKDSAIDAWEDNLIQAYIPEGIKQGGKVEITVGSHPIAVSLPYVVYDQGTKTKLVKEGSIIRVKNGQNVVKAMIWTGDDEIPTESNTIKVKPNAIGEAVIFDTKDLPLLSIVLLDSNGEVVPYYVNPIDFGF